MPQSKIHPTAIIEDGAEIGHNVTIEPYVVINKNVKLGDHVVVKSHTYLEGYTTIGDNTIIYPGVVIGCPPQAIKYQGEKSTINIGKNCQIREFVTINSSLGEDSFVNIGDHSMIMAYSHLAHNCCLGDHVIISNNAALSGHVTVEDYAIIGGKTAIHQYVRIGKYAMIGGFSPIGQDVPPFTIGRGEPFRFGGLNLVGLKRHGFPLETRRALSSAFRLVYRSHLKLEDALNRIEKEIEPLPEVKYWVDFCRNSKRGLVGQGGILNNTNELHDDRFLEDEIDEVAEYTGTNL
ncbi:MAG: Acyl-[acyl-carrier-protein]--UDP-N-acetylglucosamine O-acyltransferase [Chlamydiae bacterium]|nr:Acyl-[acyl-carrier-protein]--UDP-N-acetylglucosamine O-acyltransferase [Chlamydiota bacterium]